MTQGLAKQRLEVPGDNESEEGYIGLRSYKANPKIGLPGSKVDNQLSQRHFCARWSQFNLSFDNPLPSSLGRTRYHSNSSGRRPPDSTHYVLVASLFLFWLLNSNPLMLNPTLEFTHFTRIKSQHAIATLVS